MGLQLPPLSPNVSTSMCATLPPPPSPQAQACADEAERMLAEGRDEAAAALFHVSLLVKELLLLCCLILLLMICCSAAATIIAPPSFRNSAAAAAAHSPSSPSHSGARTCLRRSCPLPPLCHLFFVFATPSALSSTAPLLLFVSLKKSIRRNAQRATRTKGGSRNSSHRSAAASTSSSSSSSSSFVR